MKNIFSKAKKRLGKEKDTVKKYLVTLIMIFVTTLNIVILGFENNYSKLYLSLIFSCVLIFVVDTLYTRQKKKNLLYILSIVLATLSSIVLLEETLTKTASIALIGIYPVLLLFAIYKIAKENTLPKFIDKVFGNNIILGIASSIIQSGLIFIIVIITELLFSGNEDVYVKLEILFLGLFIIPGELLCITSKNSLMPEKFMKGLTKYIILPIVLIINAIIYIYLLKIVVTLNVPSNEIFKIVFGLFIIGFPAWLLLENFEKTTKFDENVKMYLPVASIPLIIMQIYSLTIRILSKGFTISRYVGIYIIILEIVTVFYVLYKKKYISRIILYLSGAIFILLCVPYINMYSIAYSSQLSRLEKLYPSETNFDNLSATTKKEVKNIYDYINYNLDMEDKLPSYIEKEKIEEYNIYYFEEPEEKYETIYYQNNKKAFSITDYDYLTPIDTYEYGEDNDKIQDFTFYDLESSNNKDQKEIVNLIKEYLVKVIEEGQVEDPNNSIIILDDKTALYLEELNIKYEINSYEVDYVDFKGYILEKN